MPSSQLKTIENPSFETEDLSGWDALGAVTPDATDLGLVPTDGTFQAVLTNGGGSESEIELESFLGLATGTLDGLGNGDATEGSGLSQLISVDAGETLTFDWNYLTNEGPNSGFNDFAFITINGEVITLADTSSILIPSTVAGYEFATGYSAFTYEFAAAGEYTIGVGVVDVNDEVVNSALVVDNFEVLEAVDLENPSFETGDLSGWEALGAVTPDATDLGLVPTDGTFQAVVTNGDNSESETELESFLGLATGTLDGLGNGDATEGSGLSQLISVEAGETLTFDWNYLTNESSNSNFNDFAFITINGEAITLADTSSILIPSTVAGYEFATGYTTFSYEFTAAGEYTIGVGVVDVNDQVVNSALVVDNFAVLAAVPAVDLENPSFETGDLSGWGVLGAVTPDATDLGLVPTDGTFQAVLTNNDEDSESETELESFLGLTDGTLDALGNGDATEGSGLSQTIRVEAGESLTFDWNYLTNEASGSIYNDFAFITINGEAIALADTNSNLTTSTVDGYSLETGYNTFSYEFTAAGEYTIGVGVVDVADQRFDSALVVDNFEVGTTAVTPSTVPNTYQPFDASQVFALNSNPDADHTIYLDFDGHTTVNTFWNSGGNSIVTPAYDTDGDTTSFSTEELENIWEIWQRVSEDFIPFDVNVTTAEPSEDQLTKIGSNDTQWGIRVVIGGDGAWYSPVDGVAYLDSFNWSSDTPAFVFEDNLALGDGNVISVAETISHEVGHTLGLEHDGNDFTEYYQGQGEGETGWAPIMGYSDFQNLTQWSQGEYANASNQEDDLAIITGQNGFGYRTDDYGDQLINAADLAFNGAAVETYGIIETNTDVDWFAFSSTGGDLALSIDPFEYGANLDILAELYDAAGQLILQSNPLEGLGAGFETAIAAGDYFLSVTGTGTLEVNPTTGYSDYASLGQYSITGTIA